MLKIDGRAWNSHRRTKTTNDVIPVIFKRGRKDGVIV
jgi:hypothetical protein